MKQDRWAFVAVAVLLCVVIPSSAADWPQFMRDAQHTGDAHDEPLRTPMHLIAQIRLDDAVLTSPAVVQGRVYVVDQMGTAYCIDPDDQRIVWKFSPTGPSVRGGNTSSPCVADGKVFYGTVAGMVYILDGKNGELVKSVSVDWPILDAITWANDSIYFQSLNGVVHCLDLQGNPRWTWDHYHLDRTREIADGKKPRTDGSSSAYFAGNGVAVCGSAIVTPIADDLLCLRDGRSHADVEWKTREPLGGVYSMLAPTIRGEWVYLPCPGKDGKGAVARIALKDGTLRKDRDVLLDQWASLNSAAVRGETIYFGRDAFGVTAYDFRSRSLGWSTIGSGTDPLIPILSAPALSKDHCLFTTMDGELLAIPLESRGRGLPSLGSPVFRWQTPHRKAISSSPAIANGRVYFGGDDGFLYVLGNGRATATAGQRLTLHQRKSEATIAGQRSYAWPSAYGNPDNANFIDDAGLKPPFKLRYALHSGGLFKHPVCATLEDIVYVTLGGVVACHEQDTGRMRWRRKLPGQVWTRATLLCAEGKAFVARMFSLRYPFLKDLPNTFFCLDIANGDILWQRPIGSGDRLRSSPIYADGVVAYGSLYSDGESGQQIAEGWDANTGESRWRIPIRSSGTMLNGPSGCVGDEVMYFTGGGESQVRQGETMAIVPRTGKILWRTGRAYASQTGVPSFRDGRIYLPGAYKLPMFCLSATDGRILWKQESVVDRWHVETTSLGPDFLTVNNKYEGGAWRWNLRDGSIARSLDNPIQLWGPSHGCGAIVLASEGFALSATLEGIYAVDCQTGEIRWKSPGFASWTCPNPIASNGRIFYCPQVSGVLFCLEPATADSH